MTGMKSFWLTAPGWGNNTVPRPTGNGCSVEAQVAQSKTRHKSYRLVYCAVCVQLVDVNQHSSSSALCVKKRSKNVGLAYNGIVTTPGSFCRLSPLQLHSRLLAAITTRLTYDSCLQVVSPSESLHLTRQQQADRLRYALLPLMCVGKYRVKASGKASNI